MNAQENSGLASGSQGLYRESFEHDACGIGALVNIKGIRSHQTVQDALSILNNMEHRGGKGLEHNTGDGAGILFQIPHRFFRFEAQRWGHLLPQEGEYGVAMIFFPQRAEAVERAKRIFENVCEKRGIPFLFWREVPTDASELGQTALSCMPTVAQAFVGRPESLADDDAFERALYVARRLIEKEVAATPELTDEIFYVCSLSCRTIVYKGMLVAPQLRTFYIDLNDARVESSLALVHSRYSTNTTPSWERAHPNRYMIHNGEINTLRGNVNWMTARETSLYSHVFGEDLDEILPVLDKNGSDSAILDNMLEFLTLSGKSLSRSAMMLLPEPWVHNTDLSEKVRAFLAYQAALMEPWDGPAALAFTDGRKTGAILDRNGLRPARYYVTKDDRLILASEVGVLDIDPALILQKGGLKPGEMLLVDPEKGLIIYDDEIKNELANQKPYGEWLKKEMLELDSMDSIADETLVSPIEEDALIQTLETYGYIYEDVRDFVEPMATLASEPTASMGVDTPLAVLSKRDKPLFSYFKQMFAQVTNPPIDSLREEIVTAMDVYIGTTGNLLEDTKENCRLIHLSSPILTQAQFRELAEIDRVGFSSKLFRTIYNRDADESTGLEDALESLNATVLEAVKDGCNIVVLSDRVCQGEVPIPSLLAVASVHHHLIREGLRTQADIVIETGDAKEVHDFAMLVGYGAGGIYPYLAHDLIAHLHAQNSLKGLAIDEAIKNYNDAVGHGIVKIMSKMGISTIQSYQGSQIFEAVGVAPSVIDRYFTHTVSRVGGLGIADLQREANHKYDEAQRHAAFGGPKALPSGGERKFRADKEEHLFDPMTILLL
ncbi:MAG: glutamate synthase subunit alpha, partial [Actinobacteria bacterium]|nr:glutamate synthase subunit alpha [Actinomycetota bacterium]